MIAMLLTRLSLVFVLFYMFTINGFASENHKSIEQQRKLSKSYINGLLPLNDDITAEELLKILPNDRFIGNKNAPIIMIEYASLSCGHCADFSLNDLPKIEQKYIKTGKVLFIFRNFPLDYKSLKASMLSFCYNNTKDYFNYNKAVFSSIDSLMSNTKDLGVLSNIANISNISHQDYQKCINDKNVMDYVIKEKLLAVKKLGVNATPTFFINGHKYDGGYNAESFSEAFDEIIKQHPNYSVINK